MKYGESVFDILYLIFAVSGGLWMLRKAKDKSGKMMGLAALILGCGDAFHLIPRVLHYFTQWDLTAALGIGKLVTSLTMTLFYVLMYYIWLSVFQERENRRISLWVWGLALLRIALCLFPQNGWLQNASDMSWGIIRNVPFAALGGLMIVLYFRKKDEEKLFRPVWILILLSFLFYIPVAVGAGAVPVLGMLMLPKTICYIWLLVIFLRSVAESAPRDLSFWCRKEE